MIQICLSNATDQQLKAIVRHDADCPTHLLSGVVAEMLNRNLFDAMIQKAIMKQFTVAEIGTKKLSLSLEELFQEARLEIWSSLKLFVPGKSPFGYFLSLKLKSLFRDMEKAFEFGRKKTLRFTESIYTPISEDVAYIDILPEKVNVERTVIKKLMFEERLKVLEANEKETFLLYLKGYSTNEISKIIGVTKSGTNRRLKRAITKLSGREINLLELGTRNYKIGA